jgi:DNA-binding transcriptional ArsR family regulator
MGAAHTKSKTSAAKPLSWRGVEAIPKSATINGMGKSARRKAIAKASAIFRMAGDPIRLNVLLTLTEGERGVGDLCTQLSQSQPAISHHLALLRHNGLIQHRRLGKQNLYSLTDRGRQVADGLRTIVPFGLARKPRRMRTKPIDPAILDDVSGFVDDAEDWFHSPNPAFEGRKPVELLGTADEPRLRNRIAAAKLGLFS